MIWGPGVWTGVWPSSRAGRLWDDGVNRFTRLVNPATELPMTVEYVRTYVLRTANDTYEDVHIEQLIRAATQAAEDKTQRAIMPQTWALHLDAFPWGDIVLDRPPLISVDSFSYVDSAGDTQQLAVSPAEFDVIPSGALSKARIRGLAGAAWPTTTVQPSGVTITYQAGYADEDAVLSTIKIGIQLMVAELYKQRSLSVQSTIQNVPAVLDLHRFWQTVY